MQDGKKEEKKEDTKKPSAPLEAKAEIKEPVPPKPTQKTEPKKEVVSTPPPITSVEDTSSPSPIEEYYNEGGSKKTLQYILWGLLILIVNGTIIGYFLFNDEIKAMLGKDDKAIIEQDSSIDIPEISEDETISINDSMITEEESIVIEETENRATCYS